ncbi:hypothetical protein BD626DRAFT_29822 [Schizophyllum amplum]|uniref:Uncharacterized protein n=1 Tax=Schizophyllum amplum TaxID=97359 RepID=A0A550D0F2_9AGAR|nr:hypothetical protein BD626DRAFT_29822 [Auriculariopsis ampla]
MLDPKAKAALSCATSPTKTDAAFVEEDDSDVDVVDPDFDKIALAFDYSMSAGEGYCVPPFYPNDAHKVDGCDVRYEAKFDKFYVVLAHRLHSGGVYTSEEDMNFSRGACSLDPKPPVLHLPSWLECLEAWKVGCRTGIHGHAGPPSMLKEKSVNSCVVNPHLATPANSPCPTPLRAHSRSVLDTAAALVPGSPFNHGETPVISRLLSPRTPYAPSKSATRFDVFNEMSASPTMKPSHQRPSDHAAVAVAGFSAFQDKTPLIAHGMAAADDLGGSLLPGRYTADAPVSASQPVWYARAPRFVIMTDNIECAKELLEGYGNVCLAPNETGLGIAYARVCK